jgi:hypothetical protein
MHTSIRYCRVYYTKDKWNLIILNITKQVNYRLTKPTKSLKLQKLFRDILVLLENNTTCNVLNDCVHFYLLKLSTYVTNVF